jgi:hypothetical protein
MTAQTASLDAVAAALAVVDAQGIVQTVNAAFSALTGWRLDTLPGRRLDTLCGPAEAQNLRESFAGGHAVCSLELTWRRAQDIDPLPVCVHVRPTGALRCVTVLERRPEYRTAEDDELLQLLQDVGRLGIWERNLRTMEGRWDRHVHRFWGLAADAPTPSFEEAGRQILPEDRDELAKAFFGSFDRPGTHSHRFRVAGADGQLRRLHSQWIVRAGADGRPDRVIGAITDDTEVWRLAQVADAAQAQLSLALELGGILVWRHDLRTNRLYYNDAGYRILGLKPRPEGLSLDEVRALIHPDDLPQVRAAMERAMTSTEPVDMEARYRRTDGQWLDIVSRRVTQRDDSGQPIQFLGVAIDLTGRLREERRAAELAQRLELAAAAAGVGVWSYTFGERHAHWNAQMFALHGLPHRSEPPDWATYVQTHVRADDRAQLLQRMKSLVDGGDDRVARTILRIVRTDGAERELSVRVRVIRDQGRTQMIGAMIDVTEQRAERQALIDAHAREALAVRSVGFGFWERDEITTEATWDEQMWRLRGLEPRGSVAPSYEAHLAMVHPDDRPRLEAEYHAARGEHRPWSVEFRVRWPDGSWHWLASRSTPLFDEGGREVRRIGVNWDITDARSAEAARQEQLAAQRESQAKSAFLARMSHELRTPLHAVIGFAELLANDTAEPWNDDARERLQHIHAAGQHLLALVNDVLDLSSLDAGDVRLETRHVPLRQAVDAVLPMVTAQAKALEVDIACTALDHTLLVDPTRLRQVLLNLLTNAVKYNRRGGRVDIEARADGRTVVIEVRDTGRGMNAQQLTHVFEPFNRLGMEREAIEGTGIGLAIVKIYVERMGGMVDVSSTPGEGSRFEVRLPAAVALQPAAAVSPEPTPLVSAAAPAGHARVLYIEDNPVNALIVRELIAQRHDLKLDEAPDGLSGIERARRTSPNLILLDMQLPDIDGMEVLRRLRADASTASIPCIALSANAMPDDIQTALGAGFADYWTKPLDFRVFMNALDSLFGKPA